MRRTPYRRRLQCRAQSQSEVAPRWTRKSHERDLTQIQSRVLLLPRGEPPMHHLDCDPLQQRQQRSAVRTAMRRAQETRKALLSRARAVNAQKWMQLKTTDVIQSRLDMLKLRLTRQPLTPRMLYVDGFALSCGMYCISNRCSRNPQFGLGMLSKTSANTLPILSISLCLS